MQRIYRIVLNKKITAAVGVLLLLLLVLTGCTSSSKAGSDDIVVLYTNDVHCAIDENIGYAGLAAYKQALQAQTPYVTLVDCGDAIQGDTIATVSDGSYIIDIMNKVGYDLAVPGNHEFDYGMPQLKSLIAQSEAQYIGANITYSGEGESALSAVKPYEIKEYGAVSVAYIGVATPHSITSSTPVCFMDKDGNFIYDFCSGGSGADLYACIQKYIDECRRKGADYVIVCSHLGDSEELAPFSSVDLIKNTSGIDAVLDGHAHSVMSCRVEQDKDGAAVLLSSTGSKLTNIGQLIITAGGNISTGLISSYALRDEETEKFINDIKKTYEADMQKVVASSDIALSCNDTAGIRLVRNRETAIGNFCADAYRTVAQSDIALANGGGIRADLPQGELTFEDIIAVYPYGNTLCCVQASGQEILDALEMGSRFVTAEYSDGQNAVGENGGFLQVAGLKYTIDTSVASTVVVDDNGLFESVAGERRVKDVFVEKAAGQYEPLQEDAVYSVASHNYLIKNCGDGFSMFADNELLIDEGMLDYEMLINYLTVKLDGKLGADYAAPDGRITVE